MLNDIESLKPSMILVQRLDRFGTANNNEIGYFITVLKRLGVRLITVIDGKDRSKDDLETAVTNAVAACQSHQEQIDKAERVLFGETSPGCLGRVGRLQVSGLRVRCGLHRQEWPRKVANGRRWLGLPHQVHLE